MNVEIQINSESVASDVNSRGLFVIITRASQGDPEFPSVYFRFYLCRRNGSRMPTFDLASVDLSPPSDISASVETEPLAIRIRY